MRYTVGVDEVGRGCLAGPVVCAAVIFPSDFADDRIKDSKTLSAAKREQMAAVIKENATAIGLGVVCNRLVDSIGIVPSVKQGMLVALSKVAGRYDNIIIDAVKLNNLDKPSISEFKADANYLQVAAASIIAKVYRDRLMTDLSELFPQYGWDSNKGYGTKDHYHAVQRHGLTIIHRSSFIKNIPEKYLI